MKIKPTLTALVTSLAICSLGHSAKKNSVEPLTQAEMIDYLTEYDLKKGIVPPNILSGRLADGTQIRGHFIHYGTTVYGIREVFINTIVTDEHQKLSLIHELYHVKMKKLIGEHGESEVEKMACETYKEWYKRDCPKPNDSLDKVIRPEYK